MQQREDALLAMALNNMANGSMTVADIALMESRSFTTLPLEAQETHPIYLFHTNAEVNAKNSEVLLSMDTDYVQCSTIDVATGSGTEQAQQQMIASIRNKRIQDTIGLPSELLLCVGACYMITCNIDTTDGLVNGAIGYICRINRGQHR